MMNKGQMCSNSSSIFYLVFLQVESFSFHISVMFFFMNFNVISEVVDIPVVRSPSTHANVTGLILAVLAYFSELHR